MLSRSRWLLPGVTAINHATDEVADTAVLVPHPDQHFAGQGRALHLLGDLGDGVFAADPCGSTPGKWCLPRVQPRTSEQSVLTTPSTTASVRPDGVGDEDELHKVIRATY